MEFLKRHPFAIEAFFEQSVVLTYAIPKEHIRDLVPHPLVLDTHQNTWAFIAVAFVKTKHLRPKGFPKIFGNDFNLIGYRVFVRYTNKAGKNLRGLYILQSETDKQKMVILGNLMTSYSYHKTDINFTQNGTIHHIHSNQSGIDISFEIGEETPQLPFNSPFSDWKEARRFAGPLPFTYSVNNNQKTIVIVEGVRENWIPKPIQINSHDIGFLYQAPFNEARLASAFIVQNIPYFWRKGKTESW